MRTQILAWGLCLLCCSANLAFAQQATENSAGAADASAQAEALRLAQAAQDGTAPAAPAAAPPAATATPAPPPPPPPAVPTATPEPPKSPLNFNNAELPVILKYIHDKTGKPVFLGEGLQEKKISLINESKQTDQENLRLLYKVLASSGIAVVESADFIEVLPLTVARKSAYVPLMGEGEDASQLEHPVIYTHALQHVRGPEIVDRLKPMVRDAEALLYDEKSNTIFYTDLQSQVDKLDSILSIIDRPQTGEIITDSRRIRNASAVEILQPAIDFLQTYATLRGLEGSSTVVQAEPETNSLLARGPSNEVEALFQVVSNLDRTKWNSGDRVTSRIAVNTANPEDAIKQAKDYLQRYVAVAGEPGDIPLTNFRYEPLTREIILNGPQPELDVLTSVWPQIDPALTTQTRSFLTQDRQAEIDRALQLLKDQYAREGRTDFQPSITWTPDPFDSSKLQFSGPGEQLTRFMALLEGTAPTQERRTRRMYSVSAQKAVPQAVDWMLEMYAQEGRHDVKSQIEWQVDNRNPAQIVLTGPTVQLGRLMPLLDKIDPPAVEMNRVFRNKKPEELVPRALEILIEEYAEEGQANYTPTTTWERDRFDPDQIVFKGPQAELDRLFTLLAELDPATEIRTRRFYNREPEKVLPQALELMLEDLAREGKPNYQHHIAWRVNDRNPAEYYIEGPTEELTRFMAVLDSLDKPTTRRTRIIQHATAEEIIPLALELMVEDFAEQGIQGYQPLTSWERDRFDPRVIAFTGPPQELDPLFQILDRLDKPTVTQTRQFYSREAEPTIRQALDLMLQQYAREGIPNYEHSITWKRDLLNPAQFVFKGPQEEVTRFFALLDHLDKPTIERTREFYEGNPEEVIPVAIDLLIADYADEGRPNYEPSITWERDRFNPKIIVFEAPAEELDRLFPILIELDPKIVTQRYRVAFATPENLIAPAKELLEQFFIESNRPDYEPQSEMWVEERDNTVAFRGPELEVTQLRTILTELDRPQWQYQNLVTQKFPLGYASAQELIDAASSYLQTRVALEGKPGDEAAMVFKHDTHTDSVLMYGPQTQITIAMEVMTEIESEAREGRKPEIIVPKFLSATQLSSEITQTLPGLFTGPRAPTVLPNDRLGALMVSGTEEDIQEIRRWAEELDAPAGKNMARQIVRLENADVTQMVGVLSQLITGAGRVIPEPRSNSLIIIDSTETISRMLPFIKQLDQLEDTEKMVHKVVKLKTADASYLIRPVQEYAAQLAERRGRSARNRAVANYEPNSGSIILFGPEEDIQQLVQVIADLDRVEMAGREPRLFYLKNSEATNISAALNQILQTIFTRSSRPPTVVPVARINALIVAAQEEVMPQVEEWIQKLDVPEGEGLEMRVIQLEASGAAYVYGIVSQFKSPRGIVSYDANTNTIVIRDIPSSIEILEKMIEQLDEVGQDESDIITEVRTIENAQVSYVYSGISNFLATKASLQGVRNKSGLYPEYTTNSLLIFGPTEEVKVIHDLIDKLDTPQLTDQDLRIYQLKHGNAAQLTSTLSYLLSYNHSGTKTPIVTYETNSNSILVQAHDKDFERVEKFLEQFDVPKNKDWEIKVIPVEGVSASTLVSNMRQLLGPNVVFFPEVYSNSIVVNAPPEEIAKVEQLIDSISMEDVEVATEIYQLENAGASAVYSAVSSFLSTRASFSGRPQKVGLYPEYTTNRLLIYGATDEIKVVTDLIDELDNTKLSDLEIRLFPIKHARADYLVSPISSFLSVKYTGPTAPYVTYEPTTNSLIVQAAPEDFERVEQFLGQIDIPGIGAAKQDLRIYTLKHGSAPQLTSTLSYLLNYNYTGTKPPVVTYETTSNSLLVQAHENDFERVEKFIEQFDVPKNKDWEIKVIPVEGANAATLVSNMRQLLGPNVVFFPETYSNSIVVNAPPEEIAKVEELIATISRKGIDVATVVRELDHAQASPVYSAVTSFLSTRSTFSGQPTQVGLYPEYTTNRLLIFGPTEEIKVVTDLIDQLDSDLLTDLEIRVFPIKNAQAAYLTSPVGNFLSVKHSGSVAPYVTYEPNSNSLIVQAAPEDFQRVAQFLEQIDVPGIGSASQEMKVMPLKNALAPQVASALNSLLSYNYTGSVRPIVTYESNSNSLIIQAHPKDFARINELLKTLDVPQMTAQEVRVYPLEYANAAQVSSVLTNILYYNYTGSVRPFVTYEVNSNSVIIQAHADDFPRVEEVIKKLDTKEVNDREMRVYQLTHVRASQIQTAVYNMLYYTYSGNVRPYVAYEDTSNTLIVQGTQDDFLKVEKILQQLDVPGTAGLESKIIPLQWANAQSIASALRPFQSPRGTVQSDDNTNSLILLDTPEALARMSKFIEELDTEGLSTGVVTEVRTLKYVDGEYLARNILNEIAGQYAERRGRKGRPETRAYSEPNSNTIIVVGATEEVETFLGLIDRFDKADFAGGETRFFQLKFTESSQLANQLSRLFRATQRGRSNVQTEVVADPYTNSIIAIGTEKDMRTIGELIQKLDIPEAGGLELEIFQLEGVNAQTLAQGLRGLQGPSRGTVMFSDPNSNTLVVKDVPEVIEQVRKVVEELRQTGGEVASFVKNLEYADASRLVIPLQQFTQLRATQEGLTRPRVNVSAEPTTNSLLIFGPTNEIQAVTELIEELDTEEFSKVEPRIFPLQHVLASPLVSPITQLLRQTTVGLNPPVVVAEQATNSLIVQGAEDDIARVQNLIDQLDQPQTGGLTTEVILLKNSSAQELSRAIRPPTLSERGTIFAESGTNSLVVTDTQAAIQRVREIVQAVDSADREIVYEVIQLKNTTVGTLEPSLQRFLTHLGRLKGVTQPLTELITDPVANSVVIYGPSDEAEVVMGLLDELDSEALFDREPGIFTLQNARAAEVVPILTQLLERDRRGRDPNSARVVADEKTNSVIVLATKGDMTRTADLISTLDRPDRGGLVTRIFRLKNSSPEVLGQTLRSYVDDPTKLFGDEASNSIVYTDTPGNLDRLGQLIAELDQISGEEKPVSVVRSLKNADASQAAQILNEFATQLATRKGRRRPLVSAIADLSSNSVTLLGPQEEIDQMIVLLQELDAESLRERTPVVRFLQRANAQDSATELQMLMSQIARGPNAPRIVANLESNALLILATPADLAVIDEMIRAIDSDSSEFRKTHVYPLEHADAATVLQSVRELVGPNARVSAHFGSNSIVITDTEANVARAFDLIQKLDEASKMEDVVTQVVPLENSNASVLVEPLTNIVNQVNSVVGQGNKPEVQVYPEIEANSIVIIGASEDVAQLQRIVTELDQEAILDREPAVFFLEKANATEIAREIQQLYTGISNRVPPRIVANTWANAIMVFADPQDTQIIGDLVQDLDQSEGRRRVVEIFELQNSDASVMAAKIAELFQYGGVDPRTSRSSRSYRYSSYGGTGRRDEGLTEGMVAVIPDLRLNALIVVAEPQDIDQVSKIIETLDVEGTNTSEPRVFQLENAEAESLAETLEQLFAEFDYTQGYYYSDSREVGVSDLSGKVRIIPDPTTNSLIVLSSSPKAFEVVSEMIAELDKPSIQEARTQIIKVNHADVVALSKTLTTIFKKEEGADARRNLFFSDFFGGTAGGGAGGGSSYSNLIGKVRIEPDTRTSSLLVVTPEVFFPSVAKIVETLDIPTKQIMLEVLIAELTRNNERDLGLQWGVDPQTGEIGRISVNNQEIFNYDTDRDDYINPFASPTDYVSGNSLADPAQFITLNNTQFNVVLNFLQSCRDINIKQRPRVTAADNLPALIRVGSETPFISSIDQSAGQTTTAVEYRPLGLTLEVTPHINSATEVTLDISVKDGAIDSSVSPLAGLAFTFTDREINTKAVVRDRHTVVLGGVIVERDRVQIDDVPVLNRLPVVGKRLFSNENTVTETVELLTFITPYVLNDSRDAKLATEMVQQESQNYSLREMDLENGKWPEEYADKNQKGPWEE